MNEWICLVLTSIYLPVAVYLVWFHALASLWRRMGKASYFLHVPFYLASVTTVILLHPVLTASSWSLPLPARLAGGALLVPALFLAVSTYRSLDLGTLLLAGELTRHHRRLITTGPYQLVRHPRYLMFIIVALADFLATGFKVLLPLFLLASAVFTTIARHEEKGLIALYGDQYRRYQEAIPALIPGLSWLRLKFVKGGGGNGNGGRPSCPPSP